MKSSRYFSRTKALGSSIASGASGGTSCPPVRCCRLTGIRESDSFGKLLPAHLRNNAKLVPANGDEVVDKVELPHLVDKFWCLRLDRSNYPVARHRSFSGTVALVP